MRAALEKRLSAVEQRLKPPKARVTLVGGMPIQEFLSRITSSERDESKNALLLLKEGDDVEAKETAQRIISLGQERKEQGFIFISEPKPAEEYNAELHEARLDYGSKARRYVSNRSEYWVDEAEWNAAQAEDQ